MEMQDVESLGHAADVFHHHQLRRDRIGNRGIEAQRLRPHRPERGAGLRIAAREQRHLVAHRDQLFRQVGDDPLGAAVEARRHGFDEGSNLGDAHGAETHGSGPPLECGEIDRSAHLALQ